jgi:alpha-1,2-mannosyltransferase
MTDARRLSAAAKVAGVTAASPRRAATLGRIGVLVALAAIVGAGQVWYGNRHGFFDLKIYRLAMRWWADGNPLYDFAKPDATQGELGFTYPPFAALVLRPLGALSVGAAEAVFVVVSVLAFAAALWWLVRPLADRYRQPGWFVFAVALVLASALEPVRESLTFGQINLILFALVAFDLLVLGPRASRFTGVGIGLATAIKLVPGVFILYLLVCRRWRAAAVATGTTIGATLLAWAVAPSDSWVFWSQKLLHAEGVGNLDYFSNQSIMGTLARLAAPSEPNEIVWFLLATAILGYGLWRAGRAASAGDEITGFTLAGLAGSLASPVTWHHHLVWFVPAVIVLADAGLRPTEVRSGLRSRAGLFTAAGVVYLTVTFSVIALAEFTWNRPSGVLGFLALNWFVLLMLALLPLLPITDTADIYPSMSKRRGHYMKSGTPA